MGDEQEVAIALELRLQPGLEIIGRRRDRSPLPKPRRIRKGGDIEVETRGIEHPPGHPAPGPAAVPENAVNE
jgi:hypothetical protein